jgi:hypothetical protein
MLASSDPYDDILFFSHGENKPSKWKRIPVLQERTGSILTYSG